MKRPRTNRLPLELHTIITVLSPINTKEKVEKLVQMMGENDIEMNQKNDLTIRIAIQKRNIQEYFIEKYGCKWTERVEKRDWEEKDNRSQDLITYKTPLVDLPAPSPPEKKKKKRKKKEDYMKKVEEKPKNQPMPSIIKNFNPEYKDLDKEKKDAQKSSQMIRKNNHATSTQNSIHLIYIPSGGMNKRR